MHESNSLQNSHSFWCSFPRILFYLLLYVGWDKTFRTVKSLTVTWTSSSVLPTQCLKEDGSHEIFVPIGCWRVVTSHLNKIKLFWSLQSRWIRPHPVGDPEENLPTMLKSIDFFSWKRFLYNISTCGEPDKSGKHPSSCWQKQLRQAWIQRVASAG